MKRRWLTPPQLLVTPSLFAEINNNNIFSIISQVKSKEDRMYDKVNRKSNGFSDEKMLIDTSSITCSSATGYRN